MIVGGASWKVCCFEDKVGIISMFTGVAGLELGMSKPKPQTLKVDIVSPVLPKQWHLGLSSHVAMLAPESCFSS